MDLTVTSMHEPRWASVLKGLVLALFGLVALAWPGLTAGTFVWLFGVLLIVSGLVDFFGSLLGIGRGGFSWLRLFIGVLELGLGIYFMQHIGMVLHTVILLVGLALLIRGVLELVFCFSADLAEHRSLLVISGLIGIIAGIIVLRYPVSSGVAFVWVVALYALLSGAVTIVLGLKAR